MTATTQFDELLNSLVNQSEVAAVVGAALVGRLSVEEIAKFLKISPQAVYDTIKRYPELNALHQHPTLEAGRRAKFRDPQSSYPRWRWVQRRPTIG